jgi:hypothetical protein
MSIGGGWWLMIPRSLPVSHRWMRRPESTRWNGISCNPCGLIVPGQPSPPHSRPGGLRRTCMRMYPCALSYSMPRWRPGCDVLLIVSRLSTSMTPSPMTIVAAVGAPPARTGFRGPYQGPPAPGDGMMALRFPSHAGITALPGVLRQTSPWLRPLLSAYRSRLGGGHRRARCRHSGRCSTVRRPCRRPALDPADRQVAGSDGLSLAQPRSGGATHRLPSGWRAGAPPWRGISMIARPWGWWPRSVAGIYPIAGDVQQMHEHAVPAR